MALRLRHNVTILFCSGAWQLGVGGWQFGVTGLRHWGCGVGVGVGGHWLGREVGSGLGRAGKAGWEGSAWGRLGPDRVGGRGSGLAGSAARVCPRGIRAHKPARTAAAGCGAVPAARRLTGKCAAARVELPQEDACGSFGAGGRSRLAGHRPAFRPPPPVRGGRRRSFPRAPERRGGAWRFRGVGPLLGCRAGTKPAAYSPTRGLPARPREGGARRKARGSGARKRPRARTRGRAHRTRRRRSRSSRLTRAAAARARGG
jgi:hypothetical protein